MEKLFQKLKIKRKMTKEKPDTKNLNNNLKNLSEIADWFDNQNEVDIWQRRYMPRCYS